MRSTEIFWKPWQAADYLRIPIDAVYKLIERQEIEADNRDGTWFIRKSVLDKVGLFDEGFFYLYEDIDLCFRVRKGGFKILYNPQAVVTHFLPRERKGLLHDRIGIHVRSVARYLLKDYYGLPLGTATGAPGS